MCIVILLGMVKKVSFRSSAQRKYQLKTLQISQPIDLLSHASCANEIWLKEEALFASMLETVSSGALKSYFRLLVFCLVQHYSYFPSIIWKGPRYVAFCNFGQNQFLIWADRSYQTTPFDKILGHYDQKWPGFES